jgi:hypothetical protein
MIQLSKTGDPADNFKICSLTSGSGFGELALINDMPRTASGITFGINCLSHYRAQDRITTC